MKILVAADLHLGRKHRLVPDLTELTLELFQRVVESPHDGLIICGDIFDTSTPTPKLLAQLMSILKTTDRPTLLISGNHDMGRKGSAAEPLKQIRNPAIALVEEGGVYDFCGFKVYAESYPETFTRVRAVREEADIYVVHGSVLGHPNSPPEDWQYELPGLTFAGHLHAPFIGPPANYPGSLLPGNFNEGHKAGLLTWDGELVERIEYSGYPTFRSTELVSALKEDLSDPKDIVRVKVASTQKQKVQLLKETENVTVDYLPPEATLRPAAADIAAQPTMLEMYSAYLSGTGGDSALLELAREFFNE